MAGEIRHKFRFDVIIDGTTVAQFRNVKGLEKETEVVEWRTGDDNFTKQLPGITKQSAITMERGMDDELFLENWYKLVWDRVSEPSLLYRKDISITVKNRDGTAYRQIDVFDAWPSKYTASDLDASDSEPWVESVEIQHNGWDSIVI